MPKEVIIAIIAGIAGVAGGIIAWIQAIRTARYKAEADSSLEKIKAETTIALEKMKTENERRRKAFEIASEESKPIETALAQAWHDIQTIKDLITRIVSPARYDLDLVLKDFKQAHSNLVEGYGQWGSNLSHVARIAWHKAKSSANDVELALLNQNTATDNTLILPPLIIESLREVRQSLTDQQMIIAASRQAIREQLLQHYLEVL
ncbi:MAG TPA: hypothetical protein VEY11_15700 [Pyrinomonadaceae bacterium]|nr:hypothetical protein [Pyrinomonadaceae bacterium]